MPAWLTVVLCIVFLYAGYLIGGHINKKRIVGTIVVDKINPEVNGGIYTVWDVEPHTLNDHEIVCLDVIVANVAEKFK